MITFVGKAITPRRARVMLALMAATVFLGAYFGHRPRVPDNAEPGRLGDLMVHKIVSSKVHAGEGYYEALASELREHNYALRPFFQWRLPTLLWCLGRLPHFRVGQAVLITLTALMIGTWLNVIKPRLGFPMTCIAAIIFGVPTLLVAVLDNCYFQHEVWAGVLIALSLGLYERNTAASVACGLAALAVRELSLAYVIVMLVMAARSKRVKECVAWSTGIAAFAGFLIIHAYIVSTHTTASDISDPSWLRFAGWPHAVACATWQFLHIVPYWVAGAGLVAALWGAIGSRNKRLAGTIIIYTAAFCVAGKPYNDYWGLMCAPLLAVSLVFCIRATIDLICAAAIVGRHNPAA